MAKLPQDDDLVRHFEVVGIRLSDYWFALLTQDREVILRMRELAEEEFAIHLDRMSSKSLDLR